MRWSLSVEDESSNGAAAVWPLRCRDADVQRSASPSGLWQRAAAEGAAAAAGALKESYNCCWSISLFALLLLFFNRLCRSLSVAVAGQVGFCWDVSNAVPLRPPAGAGSRPGPVCGDWWSDGGPLPIGCASEGSERYRHRRILRRFEQDATRSPRGVGPTPTNRKSALLEGCVLP